MTVKQMHRDALYVSTILAVDCIGDLIVHVHFTFRLLSESYYFEKLKMYSCC